ncbi:MAG: flagellar motor protein MotA, partial [Geminicoccaceae bacterium]
MSNPQRFINRMIVFLALALAALVFAYDIVFRMFMYNPILNGLILAVLLIGIFYVMRRVWMLKPEIRWIEGLRTSKPGYAIQAAPFLLTPVANALGEQERRGRVMLPANS